MPHFISSARYDARSKRVWVEYLRCRAGGNAFTGGGEESRRSAVPKLIVRDILIPDDSTLWVGVDGGGICILDSGACRMLHVAKTSTNPLLCAWQQCIFLIVG